MPVDTAEVTVQLYDFKHRVMTSLRHEVVPSDILIRNLDSHPVAPHRYLYRSGTPAEKIDAAIVAEGYTAEQASFYADAQKAVDALLQHEPFNRYADRFNFVAVALPSADTDVSIPQEGKWRNTALGSNFRPFIPTATSPRSTSLAAQSVGRHSLRTHYHSGEYLYLRRRWHIQCLHTDYNAPCRFPSCCGA